MRHLDELLNERIAGGVGTEAAAGGRFAAVSESHLAETYRFVGVVVVVERSDGCSVLYMSLLSYCWL